MNIMAATRPPRTLLEVFQSLPEGTLAQLIKNTLIMSPAPLYIHQKILSTLHLLVGDFVKKNQLGEVLVAPIDVYFDLKNVFQPDILFISNERLKLIEEDGLHGAPDLVVEILSSSTARFDLEEKKDVYERYGVKEYFIVNPETKAVQRFGLNEGAFGEPENSKGIFRSHLLDAEFTF